MSPRDFTSAMSAHAGGVVLVTAHVAGRPWGMTATAFASVSADPPTVLVSLGSGTRTLEALGATRRFGISILAADQLDVARYGAAPGAPKFLEPFAEPDGRWSGSPVVAGALAHLDCELFRATPVADHTVVFGRVGAARSRTGTPLIYHERSYHALHVEGVLHAA